MMSDDQSAIYNSLRASTAAMLVYSEIDLTAAQEIRLSRAISLRLICDAAQAAQLCGRPYDVRAFTDASESLEKMCGGHPEQNIGSDHAAAFRQIEELLDSQLEQRKRKELEAGRCERCGAPLADANNANPGGGDEVFPASPPLAVAGSEPPVLVSPAPPRVDVSLATVSPSVASGRAQDGGVSSSLLPAAPAPPPQRVETAVERMDRVNSSARPPDRYLKGPDAEWRRHIDGDGQIISPWFRPHG
jgi:hypothetical protein